MPTVIINWVAVVVAAAANMVIGAIWYSKLLFGPTWQKKVGISDKDMRKNMGPIMVGTAILALIMSFILAHFVSYAQDTSAWQGATTGFWVWLGFVLPVLGLSVIYTRRGKKLFLINAGSLLITLVLMSAILAAWA